MRRSNLLLRLILCHTFSLSACATGESESSSDGGELILEGDAHADAARGTDARERHLPLDGGRRDAPALDGAPLDSLAGDAAWSDGSAPPDGSAQIVDAAPVTPVDAAPTMNYCELAALVPANDTCDTAIDLTAAVRREGGHTTYGDTRQYQDELHPPYRCTDYLFEDGPEAVYRVDLNAGETLTVTAAPTRWDLGLYVLSTCASDAPLCRGADKAAYGKTESLVFAASVSGTYYLVVDSFQPDMRGCYSLNVGVM